MKIKYLLLLLIISNFNLFSQSWIQTALDSMYVKCILINPANNNIFVGTMYNSTGNVHFSSDNGNTWEIRSNGITTDNVYGLAISTSGTLYAATWGGKVFRSTNNGLNWTQLTNGINNSVIFSIAVSPINDYVFAGSGGSGIYRSTDGGNTWTEANNGLTSFNILALAVASNGYIFAGTYDGVFRSTDNGNNWTATSITSGWGEGFAMNNPVYNVIAAVHTGGLYRSTDFGNTFQLAPGLSSVWAIASTTFGFIYAAPYANGLYRSTDNGETWTQINSGLTNTDVRAIAIANDGNVFVGTFGGGVFKSDQPIPVELISFMVYLDNDKVKLKWQTATELNNLGFEILKSTTGIDDDSHWSVIGFVEGKGNSNEISDYVFIDDEVTVGKFWYRIKQIDFDGTERYSVPILVEVSEPAEFVLSQNYPNPFNPVTKISWSTAKAGRNTLSLYNILGQKIATILDENFEAGYHSIDLDISKLSNGLSSGVYFYQLVISDPNSTELLYSSDLKKMILLK